MLAAAFVLAWTGAAGAQGGIMSRSCIGSTCVYRWGEPQGNIIKVPEPSSQAERDAKAARIAEWERTCDYTIVRDRYGVDRYQYGPTCPDGIPLR